MRRFIQKIKNNGCFASYTSSGVARQLLLEENPFPYRILSVPDCGPVDPSRYARHAGPYRLVCTKEALPFGGAPAQRVRGRFTLSVACGATSPRRRGYNALILYLSQIAGCRGRQPLQDGTLPRYLVADCGRAMHAPTGLYTHLPSPSGRRGTAKRWMRMHAAVLLVADCGLSKAPTPTRWCVAALSRISL